jgi:nitrogenase iron protein NifH
MVTRSEFQGKTTIEAEPDSAQAGVYRSLAQKIADHAESKAPKPLEIQALREWAGTWADRLLAYEQGQMAETGAAI